MVYHLRLMFPEGNGLASTRDTTLLDRRGERGPLVGMIIMLCTIRVVYSYFTAISIWVLGLKMGKLQPGCRELTMRLDPKSLCRSYPE